MLPLSKIQDLITKHSKLEKELSSQEIDRNSFAEKSKEYSDLNDIIGEAKSYFNFQKNKDELEKLINDSNTDKEMKDLAISELSEIEKKIKTMKKKSKCSYCQKMKLIPKMQLLK